MSPHSVGNNALLGKCLIAKQNKYMLNSNQKNSALNYYKNEESLNPVFSRPDMWQVWHVTRGRSLAPISQEHVCLNPFGLL